MNKIYDFSEQDVLNAVEELVAANPDHKYHGESTRPVGELPTCQYLNNDRKTGRCLFGQALLKIGVAPEHLNEVEMQAVSSAIISLKDLDSFYESELVVLFDHIQHFQDANLSWKDSWTEAHRCSAGPA